jgi:hypothetical protein
VSAVKLNRQRHAMPIVALQVAAAVHHAPKIYHQYRAVILGLLVVVWVQQVHNLVETIMETHYADCTGMSLEPTPV